MTIDEKGEHMTRPATYSTPPEALCETEPTPSGMRCASHCEPRRPGALGARAAPPERYAGVIRRVIGTLETGVARHTHPMGVLKTYAVRAARGVAASLRMPPYSTPGHFYSPATATADRLRARAWRNRPPVGLDLREEAQLELADTLAPLMVQLPVDRWQPGNAMYGLADAAVLHAMLRHHRPSQLLEVGSGYSTAVALDVVDRWLPRLQITCIEPYADRLRSRLSPGDTVTLIETPVQEVPAETFERLAAGDILLIDSTHVLKSGSDVAWLYLHVLPRLATGVIVHVHDIHWPFEYPERWILEGRDWTEVYVLRAFLTHNDRWQIRLMTSWLWSQRPDHVPESLRGLPTGALWMQKT